MQMYTYGAETTKCLSFSAIFIVTFCNVNLLFSLVWYSKLHGILFHLLQNCYKFKRKLRSNWIVSPFFCSSNKARY